MRSFIFFIILLSVLMLGRPVSATHTRTWIDDDLSGFEGEGITDLIVQEVTATTATITWKTYASSPSLLQYSTTIAFGMEYKDDVPKIEHRAMLRNLQEGTRYFFTAFVQDSKGTHRYHRKMESRLINYSASPSFTTLTRQQEEEEARKKSAAAASGMTQLSFTFWGSRVTAAVSHRPTFKDTTAFDFSAPRITSLQVTSSGSGADLSLTTDSAFSELLILYGRDTSYGFWKASDCSENCTSNTTTLDGLVPGSEVHFKIRMQGKLNDSQTSLGYSWIETPDLSFTVPLSGSAVTIPLRQSDVRAPAIRDIQVRKVSGENRHVTSAYSAGLNAYYDIPERVELAITTDEPSQISVELLHIKTGNYDFGTIEKVETLSSSGFNTLTSFAFAPPLDAERDYAYQVTVRDAAGNEHVTRHFRVNARGEQHRETLMIPTLKQETSSLMMAKPYSSTTLLQMQAPVQTSASSTPTTKPSQLARKLAGRILLQVQGSGEAWYVNPKTLYRHYLGRPSDAFRVMREQGLGITNNDISRIARSQESGSGDAAFAKKFAGHILLQVQSAGEAWYVNPLDLKRYYLGRPADAFAVMRSLGLGISNKDLAEIP